MKRKNDRPPKRFDDTVLGILILLAFWILLAYIEQELHGKPLPYPWQALKAILIPGQMQNSIFIHAATSLLRWGTGFALALMIGIPAGMLMGLFPRVSSILSPAVTTLQLIPGLAWIPITLILFGLGNTATIFMITATSLSAVIFNTQAGIHQLDGQLLLAARTMELSRPVILRKIIIPGSALSLINGMRVGSANGFRVLISAEMVVGSNVGLGYFLINSRWTLDYEAAFGALLVIILIGLILEKGVFARWHSHVRSRQGAL